tara:strand:- start:4933 stop:5559 length:627 start_codon:yes stop_codon:yes gene_type:complete
MNKKEYKKQWYLRNRDRILKKRKLYRESMTVEQKESYKIYLREYYQNNKQKHKENNKKWAKNNQDKVIKSRKKQRKRILSSVKGRLEFNFSSNLRRALKGKKNGISWKTIVGYSINTLKDHLEMTMPDKYNWNDYINNLLEVDHIIPKSLYYYFSINDDEFKKCWDLRNLRLLTSSENSSKRNRLDMSLIEEYGINDLLPESYINSKS